MVRQASVFRSMIQSFGEYRRLTQEANNATGEMEKTQEKYADSISGKIYLFV